MSFWTILSCCFTAPQADPRPVADVWIEGCKARALFDTGSTLTLVSSALMTKMTLHRPTEQPVKLSGANGSPLTTKGTYICYIKLGKRTLKHAVTFIDNLQAECVIGMDIMRKMNISLDCKSNKIIFKRGLKPDLQDIKLSSTFVLEPHTETLVTGLCPTPVTSGLVEACTLPVGAENVQVMEGMYQGSGANLSVLMSNFSHVPVKLDKGTTIGRISTESVVSYPVTEVLTVQRNVVKCQPTDHVNTIILDHLPVAEQPKYKALLREFSDVFSRNDLDVGHCRSLPHKVRLKDPNRVTSINQYRLPYHLKEVAVDYVQKLLHAGVVRKSSSIFNSPLMLVKKPQADPAKPLAEQYRLVHNYIDLNKNIAPCSYPLRNLYELLDEVAIGKIFSVLDLSQGFFQQHLDDPDECTSFSIPGIGQYTYTRSPQGLNSSPAYFQRMLDFVLQGIDRVYVYIDDVVVSVFSHDENRSKLRDVFERFRQHNLKIKPSKCRIGSGSITYLGYKISTSSGISPGEAKTEAIKNWPEPSCIKDIRAFIGLTSFFRRAIKDFSVLSGPLNKLIRKNSGYSKGPLPDQAKESFQALKQALTSKPCLQAVDFNKRFFVTCDASATHYGSCLSQMGPDNVERPCGYSSKLLSEKEANQTPGLRERAALLHALRHWQPYLIGKEFTIRTDHKPNLSISTGRTKVYDSLTDEILQYQPFVLEYMNGNKMFVDALSRPPNAVSLARTKDPLFTFKVDALPFPSEEEIKLAQVKDSHLSGLVYRARASQPTDKTTEYSLSHSGLLLRKKEKIVVPPELRGRMLFAAHDSAGHLGIEYMANHLTSYWWKGQHKDIKQYVGSCTTCSRTNPSRPKHLSPLDKMSPQAVWFNDRVHLDIVDMPKAITGELAIVTIVDAATGFTILHPCTDKTSDSVAAALTTKLFPFFGIPHTIVTDKGKENVNNEIATLLKEYNIKHQLSSTNHPQSNGMVERRQQMISMYFRKIVDNYSDQTSWPAHIATLQLILNASKSTSRGFSPFFLTYFRHPNFPFHDLLRPFRYKEGSSVTAHLNTATKTIKSAQEFIEAATAKAKVQFDKQVKERSFSIGQVVYVYTSQRGKIHKKFAKRYKGPYICLNVDNNILDLRPLGGGKTIRAHKNNCKLGLLRDQFFDFTPTRYGPDTEIEPAVSQSSAHQYRLLSPLSADDQPVQDLPDQQNPPADQGPDVDPPPPDGAMGGAEPEDDGPNEPMEVGEGGHTFYEPRDEIPRHHYRTPTGYSSEPESPNKNDDLSDEDHSEPVNAPKPRRRAPIHRSQLFKNPGVKRKHELPAEKARTRARVKLDDLPLEGPLADRTRRRRKSETDYDPLPGEKQLQAAAKLIKKVAGGARPKTKK